MARVLGDKDVNAMRTEQAGSLAKEKSVSSRTRASMRQGQRVQQRDLEDDHGNGMDVDEIQPSAVEAVDDGRDTNDMDREGDNSNGDDNEKNVKDIDAGESKGIKSMEYHRQVFRSRMAEEKSRSYVSPSDTIMSPASAKISALRSKSALKAKPKSLFAQASAKKLSGDSPLGATPLGTRPAQ